MYKQAGIVEQHLKICLEPEAATIFTYESNQNLFHPGRKFIVVDAGGENKYRTIYKKVKIQRIMHKHLSILSRPAFYLKYMNECLQERF